MRTNIQDEKQFYIDLNAYLNKYSANYTKGCLDVINMHFRDYPNKEFCYDLIAQIYSAMGYIANENDRYYGYAKLIEKLYGINRNILEIGCGFYPAIASHIDKLQTRGTITAYDPNTVVSELGRITIYKELFTPETVMDHYDLVIGFSPCEASEMLIKRSIAKEKEFSIVLCGCTPFENSRMYNSYNINSAWLNHLYGMAKADIKKNEEISVDVLDSSYEYPFSILSKIKKN